MLRTQIVEQRKHETRNIDMGIASRTLGCTTERLSNAHSQAFILLRYQLRSTRKPCGSESASVKWKRRCLYFFKTGTPLSDCQGDQRDPVLSLSGTHLNLDGRILLSAVLIIVSVSCSRTACVLHTLVMSLPFLDLIVVFSSWTSLTVPPGWPITLRSALVCVV